MATPNSKEILRTALVIGAPGIVVLGGLVALGKLSPGAAVSAAIVLLVLLALLSINPVSRLRRLQRRVDEIGSAIPHTPAPKAGAPLTDPGGGAIGDLAASFQRLERNWTRERKALSNGLAAAATLFDALPDPLVTLDRHARLVYANAAARQLLADGRRGDVLQGRDLSAVVRQPVVLEAVGEVLAGAATREVEFTLADRVDQTFEARVEAIARTEPDDDDALALLLLRDVTARRRSEQSRADFVANVSHELRTPLTSLIGFIETLRGPAKGDGEASERFLALMSTQSERMARLVDDLLSLSRIEMNEHTAPDDAVDLANVIGTVVDLLTPQARERDISIDTQLEALNRPVVGAHDELIQLFQNLVENAIKYAREGTRVRLEAAPGAAAGSVAISVIDQGEGIASEHLSRLTERFYRVDTARSRELGGTGLGLAIVKHIVNRHRGHLKINSVEGAGSTFAVTLHFADATASTDKKAAAASAG